ncbi:hypothetical protein [uncultured Ruminococcus sp.]|uniref:hypothetical protein n=1 Tax=uncultured Ruminococcus sp. TaxID=165186 RepID=UPI00293127E0|nr:hypothetical protein [uncultured Ruminococcus sp.]
MVNTKELKAEMVRAGYTNDSLAKEIGMTPTTFGRKANNEGKFDIIEANSICLVLGITDNARKSLIFLA